MRYIGIKVGEVESVRIDSRDASKVRARLRVDRATPVKADSTAVIDFAGITGVTFVQITAGTEAAGPLRVEPYQDVPVIKAGPTPLTALFNGGADLIGQAGATLEQAQALLTQDNIDAVSGTLQNLNTITGEMATDDAAFVRQASDTLAALERAGERLSVTADTTTDVAQSLQGELQSLNTELKALVGELNTATTEANSTLAESRRAITAATALLEGQAGDTFTQTSQAAADLRILTARLDRIVRDIQQNPQSLVVGKPLPYEEKRK